MGTPAPDASEIWGKWFPDDIVRVSVHPATAVISGKLLIHDGTDETIDVDMSAGPVIAPVAKRPSHKISK